MYNLNKINLTMNDQIDEIIHLQDSQIPYQMNSESIAGCHLFMLLHDGQALQGYELSKMRFHTCLEYSFL